METLVIIIIGLIFSTLSKSAKDKKAIEKERKKRRQELGNPQSRQFEPQTTKQKSLREIFMEELKKAADEEGSLGDIFNKPKQEVKIEKTPIDEVEIFDYEEEYIDDQYISEEEYLNRLDSNVDEYLERTLIKDNAISDSIAASDLASKDIVKDNRSYNPFSKSMNRKDIIRGLIFSEVLEKPKSLRGERRST